MREVDRIAAQLTASYIGDSSGTAWYGPSLRPLLDGVSFDEAIAKLIPGRHSIAEIVMHIAANIEFVLERLDGKDTEISPEVDWPQSSNADDWKRAVDQLDEKYRALLERIRGFTDDQLEHPVVGRSYPMYDLLHGIIQHNVYHTGQIALLRAPAA